MEDYPSSSSTAPPRRSAASLYREFGMIPTSVATPMLAQGGFAEGANGEQPLASSMVVGSPAGPSAETESSRDPSSSGYLQRLWHDVESSKDNALRQKDLVVNRLYEPFVVQCISSASAAYREAFGDGTSLVSVLCRLLCADARQALRVSGFPDGSEAARALLDEPSHMIMLSYISTISDPNFFPGAVEQPHLDSIVRILALHNIPSILISLHRRFLDLVEEAKRSILSSITPQMAAADQKYLALLQNFMSLQHANTKPLLADIMQVNGVVHIAETISTALIVPFWASGSIAELAASILLSLLHRDELKEIAFPKRVVNEVEIALVDGILRDADSAAEDFGDASLSALKLAALTQSLGVLHALRKAFCTPFNVNIDFGLVVTVLLSLQDAMASQRRLTQRLLLILSDFTTAQTAPSSAPRGSGQPPTTGGRDTSSTTGSSSHKGFSFSAFASHVGKLVSSAVGPTDSSRKGGAAQRHQIACPQVVESLCQFVICASNDEARLQVAHHLFELLQHPTAVEPAFFLTQLTAIAEAVPTMSLLLLTEFLQVSEEVAHRLDASSVLIVLSRKLVDIENTPEIHIMKLISFFASLGTRSHVAAAAVLNCGVIRNSTRLVEMIGVFSNASEMLHHIHHLWMTVCRVPGCAEQFETSCTADIVTKSMLTFGLAQGVSSPKLVGQGSATLRASSASHSPSNTSVQLRREILRVSREALATLASTRSSAVLALLDRLLQCAGSVVWTDEVSCLLCALAYVMHSADDSRCATEAIKGNAIELCLSLLQSVESGSHRVDEETALLCTCLTAMLPCVRFSEVGRMLAVSIPTSLVGSTALCQMLADLSLGATREPRHVESLLMWYDAVLSGASSVIPCADDSILSSSLSTVPHASPFPAFQRVGNAVGSHEGGSGPFVVPCSKRFFCELTFPLLELCRWYRAEVLEGTASPTTCVEEESLTILPVGNGAPRPELSTPGGLRRHTPQELAQLVRAVASRLAAPLNDPTFAEFVLSLNLYDLVPFVANVCASNAQKKHFFLQDDDDDDDDNVARHASSDASAGGDAAATATPDANLMTVERRLFRVIRIWQAAVVPRVAFDPRKRTASVADRKGDVACAIGMSTTGVDPCRVDFPHHIQFFGSGGASGTVSRCGDEGWPSPEGYSVCAWCWWVDLESEEPTTTSRGSPTTPLSANPKTKILPLWSHEWRELPDPTSATSSVSCYINVQERKTVIDVLYNAVHHTVDLPLIAPSTWAHIAVAHQRNRLFNSEVSVFMDGALVKKTTLTYPLTALTQASGFSPCSSFTCRLGFPAADVCGVSNDDNSHRIQNFARGDDTLLRLKMGPFQVYNAPLSQAAVMSLFSASVHNLQAGRWFAHGDSVVSNDAVVFDRSVLNYLAAAASNDLLQQVVESGACTFVSPPHRDSLVVSLHPSAAALADASFRYLDNHDWVLVNLANAHERTSFTLYGPHSEPTVSYVDAAHALVASGGTTEWMRWLRIIASSFPTEERDDHDGRTHTEYDDDGDDVVDLARSAPPLANSASATWRAATAVMQTLNPENSLRELARGAVSVIASCVARVSVKELRHRAFYYNIALLIRKHPRLFLVPCAASATLSLEKGGESGSFALDLDHQRSQEESCAFATIASLCFTLVHADGAALGSRALTDAQVASRSLLLPVLSNTALFEMVFANTSLWAHLPHTSSLPLLQYISASLHPSNRYRRLNARRMKANGFMTSFVYGIVRHYVPLAVLPTAIETISSYICALDDDGATVSDVITFLAASVPAGHEDAHATEKRLGSKLARVAPEYIVLVRNLVLKSIVELMAVVSAESSPAANPQGLAPTDAVPVANRTLFQTVAEVMPLSWAHAMTGPLSHPTTVALALQMIVVLLQFHISFRQRAERSNLLHLLTVNLSHHSHQPDVTSLLLHGFLGHSRNVMVFQSTILDDQLAPVPQRGVPFLVHVVLSLQKCNAIGSRDPTQIDSSTTFFDQAPACGYFSQMNRVMSRAFVARSAQKLRAVMHLVRCVLYLVRSQKNRSADISSPAGGEQRPGLIAVASPVTVKSLSRRSVLSPAEHHRLLRDESLRRMDLVSRVLNWAAFAFLKHDYVACAMFNPGALCAATAGISMMSALPSNLPPVALSSFHVLPQLYGDTYPIDFVAWIVVCALGQADTASHSSSGSGSKVHASRYLLETTAPSSATDASPESVKGSGATAPKESDDDEPEAVDVTFSATFPSELRTLQSEVGCGVARSRSAGLDRLPPPAYEPLFQACCNMFVAMMELQVREYVAIYVGKQNIKTAPFTLVLHHVLCLCPSNIGDEAEACYHAALISLWLQTTSRALQRHSLQGERGHHLSKNCVSVAHYVTERLVSGLPTPPGAVIEYLTVLLGALQYADHIKQTRHLILEWGSYVLSPKFHNGNVGDAHVARDLVHANRHLLFGPQVLGLQAASMDAQRHLLVKLMELSTIVITNFECTQSPEAQRIAELWQTVLQTMKQSPALSFVLAEGCGLLKASGAAASHSQHYDFYHGGFDILFHRIGATSMFLSWFADSRYAMKDYLQHHPPVQPFHQLKLQPTAGLVVLGKRYVKWVVSSTKAMAKSRFKHLCKAEAAVLHITQSYERLLCTGTFVDPKLLQQWEHARSDVLVVATPTNVSSNASSSSGVFKQYWSPHVGGIRSSRWYGSEALSQSRLVDLGGEPLGVYFSDVPVAMVPLLAGSTVDGVSTVAPQALSGGLVSSPPTHGASSTLKPNAFNILHRILSAGSLQPRDTRILWIGNVYYIVGTESVICTLVLTRSEFVWISHSQVTRQGDFFITQIAPHTAVDKAHKKRSAPGAAAAAIQEAISRFLPKASALVSGGSSSKAPSLSTHRHSQYYRQLRTEALQKDHAAFVWRCGVSTVAAVHHRRFQHQSAGLELRLDCGTAHFFVVLDYDMNMTSDARSKLVDAMRHVIPSASIETEKSKDARVQAAQKRWMRGALSTRAYLAVLNDAASRTTSDLSQYPIMPWVLSQYDEIFLDLQDKASFRDLTKPMGALNPNNALQIQHRYEDWPDDTQPPFHYGTHYSTSAVAMYYLVRLEPFHQWSVRYQGGRLDVADRLFHSVAEAWMSTSGAGSDVKELIPEFYSTSSFARNDNNIALGVRRDGVSLHHVVLPPWCGNQPELFTATLCEALESDVVAGSIHDWIDLIFGVKQRGEEAVRALNVFHHLSYDEGLERAMEAALNEEDRKAIVASVDNFGLTPPQLFSAPHPCRLAASTAAASSGSGSPSTVPTAPCSAAPRQITFLAALSQLIKRTNNFVLHVPVSPISGQRLMHDSVTETQLLDSMIYASSATAKYCGRRALQVIYLEESTSSVHVSSVASVSAGGGQPGGVASSTAGPSSSASAGGVNTSGTAAVPSGGLVLPGSASFGTGWVTCVCASAGGNVVLCGTDKGCVVVYTRSTSDGTYSISNFIYASSVVAVSLESDEASAVIGSRAGTTPGRSQGRVRYLQLWDDGQLLVASEPGTLSGWHVTTKSAAFCFAIDVTAHIAELQTAGPQRHASVALEPKTPTPTPSEDVQVTSFGSASAAALRSPGGGAVGSPGGGAVSHVVRFVSRDNDHKHYYAATDKHILVVSSIGTVLTVLSVHGTNPFDANYTSPSQPSQGHLTSAASFSTRSSGALASTVLSSQTLSEPVTSIAYCNFTSHSTINVLMCGHANGCVSVWTILSDVTPRSPSVRTLHFHSCLQVEKGTPVTSISPVMESSLVVFGLYGGGVVVLGLPNNIVEGEGSSA